MSETKGSLTQGRVYNFLYAIESYNLIPTKNHSYYNPITFAYSLYYKMLILITVFDAVLFSFV